MSDLVKRLREGGCGDYCDELEKDAADRAERAEQEAAALREDAERLDFLHGEAQKHQVQFAKSLYGTGIELALGYRDVRVVNGDLRAAIDSAMREGKWQTNQPAPEPVMYGFRSKRDGSFSNQVAVCTWATFDREMDKLRADAWVQKGIAEIVPLYAHPAAPAPASWQDIVEQRLLSWHQRFVNKSGDQLALDDFMDKQSLDDLIDFVCDQYAAPAPDATVDAVMALADETNLVQRLRALSDLCTWANAGWDLPPSACAKIRAIAAEAADKIISIHPAPPAFDAEEAKDAERYRWLRSRMTWRQEERGMATNRTAPTLSYIVRVWYHETSDQEHDTIDAAIDAALKEGNERPTIKRRTCRRHACPHRAARAGSRRTAGVAEGGAVLRSPRRARAAA